jgi:hypothetical protein
MSQLASSEELNELQTTIKLDGVQNTLVEDVQMRTFEDAEALLPAKTEPIPINLVRTRNSHEGFFPDDSYLVRCFSCIKVSDYTRYFEVTTFQVKERLRFALIGHFVGMNRPNMVG